MQAFLFLSENSPCGQDSYQAEQKSGQGSTVVSLQFYLVEADAMLYFTTAFFYRTFVGTHLQLWLKLPDLFFQQSKHAFGKVKKKLVKGFLN